MAVSQNREKITACDILSGLGITNYSTNILSV